MNENVKNILDLTTVDAERQCEKIGAQTSSIVYVLDDLDNRLRDLSASSVQTDDLRILRGLVAEIAVRFGANTIYMPPEWRYGKPWEYRPPEWNPFIVDDETV